MLCGDVRSLAFFFSFLVQVCHQKRLAAKAILPKIAIRTILFGLHLSKDGCLHRFVMCS